MNNSVFTPTKKCRLSPTSVFDGMHSSIGELKLELQSGNAQFGSESTIFWPYDLQNSRMTLENNRAPKQHYALCIVSSSSVNSS